MSKKLKIVIGVIVALVIVGCVGVPIAGAVFFRGRFREMRWQPVTRAWREVGEVRHPQVGMVDEDEGGKPDRRMGGFPAQGVFGRGRFDRGRFDRGRFSGFGAGQHMPFGGRVFGLFFVVRGLFDVALLVAVVVLGVALYRQRHKAQPATLPASE